MKRMTESAKLTLLTFIFLAHNVFAQYKDDTVYKYYPFCDSETRLYGYSDSKGNILIEPRFRWVRGFYQGFAAVRGQSNYYGIINTKGEWVVEPTDYYEGFIYGNGVVYLGSSKSQESKQLYIHDGMLFNKVPDDAFTDYEKELPDEPEPTFEIQRYFDFNQWMLGEVHFRKGKSDSLVDAVALPIRSFASRITKVPGWNICEYNSDDEQKTGLIAWSQTELKYFILDELYDSIRPVYRWSEENVLPNFFGYKGNKKAIIKFNDNTGKFFVTPAEFDEVKDAGTEPHLARIGNEWFILSADLSTKEFLVNDDVRGISTSVDGFCYYSDYNGHTGLLMYKDGKWLKLPAEYNVIVARSDYFVEIPGDPNHPLFECSTIDGKIGWVTMEGIKLFR